MPEKKKKAVRIGNGGPEIAGVTPDMRPANNPPPPAWYQTKTFRRVAFAVAGGVAGSVCPSLPPPARVICEITSGVVGTVGQALEDDDAAHKEAFERQKEAIRNGQNAEER